MPRPTDWNAIGLDSDPTPGDPDQIRTLSTELNNLGAEARRISTAIDAVMNTAGDSVFVGEAANALRDKVNDRLRGHVEDVAQSFETAATALSTWADKLVELQSRADGALNSGRGLSEDDSNRETYASTARQAGTEHGEGAATAAGSISGVSNIQLPISKCQLFWEAFQWLAIILIVPALIFGGPIALLALGVNLTLFIKTIVDFANGDASFLDLFLAGLGILAPTTKALPIFQIIKGVTTTAFAKGFANIARGTFQALRNLFTNGFRPTTLLLGLKDLVKLGSTWVYKGGLWVLDGIHNLPGIIGRGVNSAGLTIVQGIKGIPGFVRGLPETFSKGWQATKTWVGQELGGTKWLRIFLPVDAAEIGEYGFARALRISLFDRGVLGQHVFGAPITSSIGRTISSVPVDPRTVDALVDMPRIQLNEVRFGAGSGQSSIRNLDLHLPSTHLDVTSTLRPPSLNLGDVGAIAHRGNFGVHAARTVDALVDMPHVQLGNVHVENFGALGGRSDVGVSVGATPTVTTASGLHLPASAGVPGATHGLTNTPVTGVTGGAHTTLTGLHPTPTNLTSTADVLLPGGAHNGTHVPGTTVLTGTHATPPPVAGTLGDISTVNPSVGTLHAALTGNPGVGAVHAPGTPGLGTVHTTLTGTPGTNVAHTALDSTPTPGAHHDVTAPNNLLTGPTTVTHPSPTGIGHGGPGSVDAGTSAFDLLAGTRHSTPNTPVAPGTGNALADRTTSALSANQTRLHLDELVQSPGSPHPGTPQQLLANSPTTPPVSPERLTTNPASVTTPDRLTANPGNAGTPDRFTGNGAPHDPAPVSPGGSGHPGAHSNSAALDLVDTGRSARTTDSPAFAGAPTHTDADKGLAGSANGTSAHVPEDLPTHATPTPPGTHTPLPPGHSSPAPAAHTADTTGAFDDLLKDPNVVKVPGNHQLAVKAPRGGTPELHGGAVESGLYTVEKQGTGFVVRQLDAVGGTVAHSWTFKRLGGIRLAEETVRFGDGPFSGVSVKVAGKSVDSLTDATGTWPAKLSGEHEIVVASTSGSHVYSRSTGALLRSSTPDVTLPPRPAELTGASADSWDAAAHAARGHMGKAATDNETKLFMQGVIGGAFTSKKGYGGFVNPSALEANPGLVGKVKQFNKVAGDLMFEGPNQRMTVWRGVSMDPRAAQADVFVERLPASTSNNRAFQAEWAKNGVNSNRVVFEIDVPADHGKLAMAYPPGYHKAADDALALNQDQWEITLSPTRLVRTGPARVEDGITVVPVRAEQIPEGQLDKLINEKWSGLQSGEAFEDFGRAFGQDAMRRWEGLGDAVVREGGDGPNVKTFTVSRPGFADEMTVTVTHKADDNAVSVTITGGDRTFTKEWSGTGFNDLAADLRGHVLHNNELLSSLPTPTSWSKELPSPVHTSSHPDTTVPSPTRTTPDTDTSVPATAHAAHDTETAVPGTTHSPVHTDTTVPSPTRGTPDTETAVPGTVHATPNTTPAPRPDTPHSGGQELPGRGPRLTPAEIEQAWFRDGERVDALFGHLDDPLRGARREAWRDHVQARYDVGRAEDLLPDNGHAGGSRGPTPDEIRARENVDIAQQRYDATHHRLTELGVDPVRMEADLGALRQLSLKERPRLLGGTVTTANDATPPPATAAHAAHGETGAASVTPPRRLNDILADQTKAHKDLQQAEIAQTQLGKDADKIAKANADLAEADTKFKDATRELDEALQHELDNRLLSQRELNMLVDQFAGAGDIDRALKLQTHARQLDAGSRGAGDGPVRSDQFIRTGEEIQSQSVTVQRLANELENLVKAGTTPPAELKVLAEGLENAAKDLDAALQGHVTDAARFGGAYTLRNQHTPVAAVAHHLAELVDDAVKAAKPGDNLVLKGFLGTDASVERVRRGIPDLLRRYRENQAFGEVHSGSQWNAVLPGTEAQWRKVFEDFDGFDKLSRSQQHDFVRKLSEKNIADLRADVDGLLKDLPEADRLKFQQLRDKLENLPYRIKHATPAYHAIANSGVMSSQGDLTRRGVKFLASGKSSAKNTSNLGNDDFVFFRMEVGDKPMATRYGPTTLVFDAKVLEEKGGWVSLHDQLHPLDRDTMNQLKVGDDVVRSAKYDDGFDEVGRRGRWTYEYPDHSTRQVSFEQEVFHGEHVQEALALSVVREVHLIGGAFKDDVFKLLADTASPEELGSVISKLYRPEAKFGSGLPINPFESHATSEWPSPLAVHDADGDGRYLADGTVDPAARAAGKAFDDASDRVRQADNAVKSGNNKALRYNLNKAQPHAEQSVKLTQEFHAAAVGERKEMAKTLLDQREQLLKDINTRLDALKPQAKPETAKPQPGPGKNQGAGTSSSAAGANGPNLSELPQLAENALQGVAGITDQMKKMVRALANSDGFRSLPNSKVGTQTTAAVDLGRTAFDKAFKHLFRAGLVHGDSAGLHFTDEGRRLFLPPGADAKTATPSVSAATDVHTNPAHAQPQLPHTQSGPETKAPALTGDGLPSRSLDTDSPAPHHADTDTTPPAPHDLDTTPPAPHDLDTKSPAPHGTDTHSPAPRRIDSETAPPLIKESDTAVSHSPNHGAATHPLDAETAPQHLSDTTAPHRLTETETETLQPHPLDTGTPPSRLTETDTTTPHLAETDTTTPHLADTETRTPHLADTDTTPPHPTESDAPATHLDDIHSATPHRGDNGDFTSMPPKDDTRLGDGRSARPLGDAALDDMLRPPRRTGDTTGTTASGTAHPAAPDLLDRAVFRRNTYRENGIRARSQIRYVDRALDAFHHVPADQLARRAEALDNLADAAGRFLRDRPDSVRRAGVEQLLNQVRAEANAYRLLDDFRRLGDGADGLAGRTRTALAAGGTTPHTQTRLQTMLDGLDRSAQAQRQNDALSLLDGTPPLRNTGDTTLTAPGRPDGDTTPAAPARLDGDTTPAAAHLDSDTTPAAPSRPNRGKAPATPSRQPGETPWAEDSARFDELLGGDGRPFREAWVELSSARIELNRVEDLRGGPGGASTSRTVSTFDVQLNHELVAAQDRFRAAYQNLEHLGIHPTEIEARIHEIQVAATHRGATLGAGKLDTLPDTAPPAVNHVALNNSGVSAPNGLTIERSVGQDNAVTLRVLDQQLHPDPLRTVVARPDGGFDVRHTPSDTVTTYTANGDRIADDMPLYGADGRPTGLRLHTDLNAHGLRQTMTVNGPGADRLTAFPLPGDAARITHLDTGATHRVDALGLRVDEGVQLTGRDGVPAGTDRVWVTDGADVHVTDLAGNRLDLRVQDLGDGNGIRVTDGTTGVSVRHDGRGRLQETGVSLTDPRGTRGQRFLADDGTGRFTLTDPSGARQPQTVTALPGGTGFRVTDETSGATSRFTADGRYQDTGLALFDPAANTRGGRIAVPDGAGGHLLTDTAGQPLPQRVVAVGGNRPRTIDDVTGESVLYDAQGHPVSASTALADPAGGPRGGRFAEPDGAGGHRLTDADGNRLPDTVTALPNNGGFRTVHDTGHRTFGVNGDFAGDGLRLTGRDGVPAGHLDRPLGAAPHWLDDAFAAAPARAVTFDAAGRIEIARPGGGRQVFDQHTGRFAQETVPLPGGGHRTTLADGTFTRYDGQGAVTATGTPLPVGHGGRHLVVAPPTAQHPGAWLEDGAGGRLAHWDAVRRPDGTTRIVFNDRTSPRHGEFVHLAADGSVARQGFNVLDNGRRTDYRYVVDHATGTWDRTTRSGAPVAAGSFHHGTADLSGAAGGHIKLLSSTKKQVPVFERRVLPGASGDVVDSFRRTDTIDFARTNPRTHWVRWDDTGTPLGTGSRHYDTAGTGWRDTDGWGRTVREYRDGLQKFNGRTGHTLGVDDGNGAWTWHRYDGNGKVIASGPRTRERIGSGWTDRTADGRIAQQQWGMAEWPERAGQYQEHAMNPADGTLRATWERHSPHGKEVGKHEALGDGFLTTDRWREQRPPTWVRTRWLAGAEHTLPPYAHVRGDDTYQLFTWTKEANDGTVAASGVRYVGMDGSALDLAADGTFARFSGKLHDGTSLKVGDHAGRPGHAPANPTDQPWQAGNVRGYREPLANDPAGRLWQDVYQDAGGTTRIAREGLPGGVVREYTGLPENRLWVERDPHGNLVGQSHAKPDQPDHVIQGSGRADSGRWTWRELDANGAQVGTGEREFFRGSTDSRLPWDDSYRDFDAHGQLVRERRMLDSGNHVDAWRDTNGWWTANVFRRDGTALDPALANQVRRWWHDGSWQEQWAPGARHFRDSLPGTGQAAPTVLRETPLHNGGPLRVRAYSTTVTQNTPAGSVWKEFDHGSVVRERKADGGGFLETDAWRGQWNRYNRNGDLIAQRTDSGLVFERDTFNTWRLVGNEYDFRGALTEIRGWGRTTREAQRMPWSGTVLPDGNAALREARYEPYWQSVAKKAALEFGQEFILEFGANLAVNGIVAAVQNKPFTGKDALKSFANAAVGATIKTGLSTAVHENRALGFENLGKFKAGIANVDGGKPWTRRPLNHDKTWVNEWAGNETPTRWRGGAYDFSFGVLSSALSGWVNGSMNAAVWGVTNADGQTVKLHGGDAVWEGGINAAASVTTAATTGLVKNVFVMSAGSRLFHRQGFADFWIQLPFKIFEKSIQSLYLTSTYRASINPTYYQAP
ncbi:hypothetical protein ABT075_11615 [Streptomyces sp. NPDC002677]|uniref:hypothetical protein n=1 Tax=Streptomyces sp. NPDC002677 TaxID=3154774 RepID=UPI00332C844C